MPGDELYGKVNAKDDFLKILELIKNSGAALNVEDYVNIVEKIEALNQQIDDLQKKDSYGLQPDLSSENAKNLSDSMKETSDLCAAWLERYGTENKLKAFSDNIIQLQNLLSHDSDVLDQYAAGDKKLPLDVLIDDARARTIDISGKQLNKVGAAQSSRVPMTYTDPSGKVFEGVFTPEAFLDYEQIFFKGMEKFGAKYPDYKNIFTGLLAAYRAKEPAKEASSRDTLELSIWILQNCNKKGKMVKILSDLKLVNAEDANTMRMDSKYNQMEVDFVKQINSIANQVGLPDSAGMEEHTRVDSRNSAMSSIADLLGVSNVICKAIPMQLKDGDKIIKGTFMEAGRGIDPMHPTREILNYDRSNFTYASGIKDMANLQVLDFICGNIDRHGANMFYQFGPDGKLTGVCGIDNDTSFGLYEPTSRVKNNNRLAAINDIKFIPKSTAQKLMALDKNTLKYVLRGHQISEKAIDSAWNRLSLLKNAIQHDAKHYDKQSNKDPNYYVRNTIKVVDDNDFVKMDVMQHTRTSEKSIFLFGKRFDEVIEHKGVGTVGLDYTDFSKQSRVDAKASTFIADTIDEHLDKMEQLTSSRGTSTQFEALREALKKFQKFSEDHRDKPLDMNDLQIRNAYLKETVKLADDYLEHKRSEFWGPSKYAQNRIDEVNLIKDTAMQLFVGEPTKEEISQMKTFGERAADEFNRKMRDEFEKARKAAGPAAEKPVQNLNL